MNIPSFRNRETGFMGKRGEINNLVSCLCSFCALHIWSTSSLSDCVPDFQQTPEWFEIHSKREGRAEGATETVPHSSFPRCRSNISNHLLRQKNISVFKISHLQNVRFSKLNSSVYQVEQRYPLTGIWWGIKSRVRIRTAASHILKESHM